MIKYSKVNFRNQETGKKKTEQKLSQEVEKICFLV